MKTFTTGSDDITTPPFEHKVVVEKTYTNIEEVESGWTDKHETYGLIRFIKPTGRGMREKYLRWLQNNLGGLEFELAERVYYFYEVHGNMMKQMFGDDVPLTELPYTYKVGFVEFKPRKSVYQTKVLRIPFMFFDEGKTVLCPARGNEPFELSPLGFSLFVNGITTNVYLSYCLQDKFKKEDNIHQMGLGMVNKKELMYWDNFLRLTTLASGIFDNTERSNLHRLWD